MKTVDTDYPVAQNHQQQLSMYSWA